jgi:CDP-glucose 4,6-dehydratase
MKSFWQDKPVLVTGATGLVGGWLVRRLLEAGAEVTCLVRDWVPRSDLVRSGMIDRVKLVRGDVCDRALLERGLGEHEVEAVFHLAAQTIVGIANRNPVSTFEANIQGTWSVLEACRRSPAVKAVVLASSDKAYGDQPVLPYDEQDAAAGPPPLRRQQVVRGPDRPHLRGQLRPAGRHHAVRQLLRRRGPELEPDRPRHHPLGPAGPAAGDPLRRPLHPRLLLRRGRGARLHGLAEALRARPELAGEAFNFSNELQVTVLDLVRHVLREMDSDLEPDVRNEASNEIVHQYLSAAKAAEVLGWEPMFGLDEGIRRTIDWYRGFLSHDKPADSLRARISDSVRQYHATAFAAREFAPGRSSVPCAGASSTPRSWSCWSTRRSTSG